MNNSKQTVLSIVGIAILVIAVVGVSFAFFTYSKTGTTNNIITTGSITFSSTNGDTNTNLTLVNEFPQAAGYTGANHTAANFTVTGNLGTSSPAVNYGVYLVAGDAAGTSNTNVSGLTQTHRFANSQVSAIVSTTATGTGNGVVYPSGTALNADSNAIDGSTGLLVAYGTIPATGSNVNHTIGVKMWVNSSVTISDTTPGATYRAKAYDGTDWPEGSSSDQRYVYSDCYYTAKVKVLASDTDSYVPGS